MTTVEELGFMEPMRRTTNKNDMHVIKSGSVLGRVLKDLGL